MELKDLKFAVADHFKLVEDKKRIESALKNSERNIVAFLAKEKMFDCFSISWQKVHRVLHDLS